MAQCVVRLCEICEKSPGKKYCTNCDQYFCNNCELSHLKAKVSKNHIFKDADNVDAEVKIPQCERHGNEMFTYYCYTCSCLLCPICLPETHKRHEFSLIAEAAMKKKAWVSSTLEIAEADIAMVSEKAADLKNRITTYSEDTKSVIQDIEDRRKEMVEMVNKTIDDLVKTVNKFESKECKKMAEYIKKISIAVENDKITVANARKTVENTNNLLLLESDLKFEKDLQTYKLIGMESYALEKVRFVKGPTTINKQLQDFAGKLQKKKESKNESKMELVAAVQDTSV